MRGRICAAIPQAKDRRQLLFFKLLSRPDRRAEEWLLALRTLGDVAKMSERELFAQRGFSASHRLRVRRTLQASLLPAKRVDHRRERGTTNDAYNAPARDREYPAHG